MLDDLRQDIRYGVRLLRSNRVFAAIAILTFAVGVGATTAIFSVVNATLIRPLPYREPDRLMSLFLRMPVQYGSGEIDMVWSYPKYSTLLQTQRVFSDLAPHVAENFTIGTPDGAEIVRGESVGARYFTILGVVPASGRFFTDTEDRASGGDRVVVISDGFWRERFSGSAAALGGRVEIGGNSYTIIGVAPPGFRGMTGAAQLWPLYTATRTPPTLASPSVHQFEIVARLSPGVSVGAARAAMAAAGTVVDAAHPDDGPAHWRAAGYSLSELRVDPLVGKSVIVLAAAVSLLLLIACVNIASLLLARGAARRRELSVRLAIGATGRRLIQQLLVESVVLGSIGVMLGLLIAAGAVRALSAVAPLAAANLSTVRGNLTAISLGGIGLDSSSVVFSVAIAMFTAIGAGLAPAIAAARLPLADAMRQGSSSAPVFSGLRRLTPRGPLVIGEIALAVILLVGSGLMIRSLSKLFEAQVGYQPDHLLTARVVLNAARARNEPIGQMWDEVIRRVAAMPGVVSVAVGSCAPVGDHCDGTSIELPGRSTPAHVSFHVVTPNYFKTLGIPVIRGREVSPTDQRDAPAVMVINQAAARSVWGATDPLATPLPRDGKSLRVVGIVGDVRYEDVQAPAKAAVFFPWTQSPRRGSMLFVRTSADLAALGDAVRREIRALDRNHTVNDIKTMAERTRDSSARNRFATQVLTVFATIALALAALGIYGVLSLAVAQRGRELSIRIALGADGRRMLGMVMGEAAGLALAGAVLGTIGSYVAARWLGALLYDVSSTDPATYAVCALVLAAVAGLAALVPALRAMRVQPAAVLRGE